MERNKKLKKIESVLNNNMSQIKICKNCKHFNKEDHSCKCNKFHYSCFLQLDEIEKDEIIVENDGGYGMTVGEEFGCIHYSPKKIKVKSDLTKSIDIFIKIQGKINEKFVMGIRPRFIVLDDYSISKLTQYFLNDEISEVSSVLGLEVIRKEEIINLIKQ